METELWPNTLHACSTRGIPIVLTNARLSARSARGYGRLASLTRDMLGNLSAVAAQAQTDGERFVSLGLPRERLYITGSVKFDIDIDDATRTSAATLRKAWGSRPVWIAASTHEGEDAILLQAHRQLLTLHPQTLLVLVPRHPERFDGVARLAEEAGFCLSRRSTGQAVTDQTQVMLGDTMGELLALYGTSDIAFIGGSLVARGGHNMLEPAAWGLPLLTGTSDFNFQTISQMLRAAGALQTVTDSGTLAQEIAGLINNAALRQQRGQAGLRVVQANRGALARQLALLDQTLKSS